MDRSRSARFARVVARCLADKVEPKGSHTTTSDAIHAGVFEQLFEFIPDAAVAIVLGEKHGEEPNVLALCECTLYVARYVPEQFESHAFRPCLVARSVSPEGGYVSISTLHGERTGDDPVPREVNWKFSFTNPDYEISFMTVRGPHDEVDQGEREAFAFALARALGCPLGGVRTSGPDEN